MNIRVKFDFLKFIGWWSQWSSLKFSKKRFALHGSLTPPTGFITQWTSKNQMLILNWILFKWIFMSSHSVGHSANEIVSNIWQFGDWNGRLRSPCSCQHRLKYYSDKTEAYNLCERNYRLLSNFISHKQIKCVICSYIGSFSTNIIWRLAPLATILEVAISLAGREVNLGWSMTTCRQIQTTSCSSKDMILMRLKKLLPLTARE